MEYDTNNIIGVVAKSHFRDVQEKGAKYTLADKISADVSDLGIRVHSSLKLSSKPQQNFVIKKLRKDDKEEILCFLNRYFFRDEPLNIAVKLLETADSRCEALEDYSVRDTLCQCVSLGAVADDGELVGLLLNGISCRNETVDWKTKIEECGHEKFCSVLKVLAHLDMESKVWERLPDCDQIMDLRIASTHPEWRGRGLMKSLIEETEALSRKLGIRALRMDATSAYSAAAATRLKYERIYCVPYAALADIVPAPPAPHTHCSVFVKRL